MNKQVLISLSVVLVGGSLLLGLVYWNKGEEVNKMCPLEVMVCPDGSTVSMTGPNCEYGVCKDIAPAEVREEAPNTIANEQLEPTTTNESPLSPSPSSPETPKEKPSLFSTIIQNIVEITENVTSSFSPEPQQSPSNNTQSNQPEGVTTPTPQGNTSSLNEERFTIEDGSIIDSSGNAVASIPGSSSSSTGTTTWETTIVNAIEVGQTPPVVNGVPVIGAAGKYYVSENSFGSIEDCEFSNKVYILDTIEETYTLLFEENSSTLSKDDPRACNSEIFLLATEDEKLILKYHTLNTNMTCESTWSEPDKTWYLDVTNLSSLMRRYQITSERYSQAETEEITCRAELGEEN
jgi:hypothetical protein